jgi:tRNA threonylcarbamoyladenosine biosynthesis protein TsaE
MKYLAQYFGVSEIIQSPTFVIMKCYKLKAKSFKLLYHIDAYRIEDPSEMLKIGWSEIIKDSQSLICVEWPERLDPIIGDHIMLRFEHVEGSENQRKIGIA